MFLQNWLCSRKFSIWVNFSRRIGWSRHPCFIGRRPLTRSWFRFWFWWQFNGDFFDRLVSLFFFAQLNSWFYFCVFWISYYIFVGSLLHQSGRSCANSNFTRPKRSSFLLLTVDFAQMFKTVGTYWIYNELPKHLDSFR